METIIHGKTQKGKRFTVVGIYDRLSREIRFGIALCGPKDNFSKRLGRVIARGRALKNPTIVKHLKKELPDSKKGYMELNKLGRQVLMSIAKSSESYQKLLTEQYKEHKRRKKHLKTNHK